MQITFKRDTFLSKLFKDADISDDARLREAIIAVYAPHPVEVTVHGDKITITLPDTGKTQSDQFFRATELCRKGKYAEAIHVFESLIEAMKTDSEIGNIP